MKNLRTVAPEERPAMGKIINELKQKVQTAHRAGLGGQGDIHRLGGVAGNKFCLLTVTAAERRTLRWTFPHSICGIL